MRKTIIASVLFALELSFSTSVGQVDTIRDMSYLPLAVGNKWQYIVSDYVSPYPHPPYYHTIAVRGDTLLPNGRRYFILNSLLGPFEDYFRKDSTTFKVYKYYESPACEDSEIVYFDLLPPDSGYYVTCEGYPVYVDTGYTRIGALTDSAKYISHSWYYGFEYYHILSRGIGISYWFVWELSGFQGYLVAAEINGIQYGQFVGVSEEISILPGEFALAQNFPNPFNPSTTISFSLPRSSEVSLKIFNVLGQEVATLVNEEKLPGFYQVQFDARGLASGIYFYRLRAGEFVQSKKLLLLR